MTTAHISRQRFVAQGAALTAGPLGARHSLAHWTPPVMSWKEWASYDALGLAELIRSGEVSVLEVAEQTMHATHLVNPTTNAVLEFYYDKLAHGKTVNLPKGIFHGVPYFLKMLAKSNRGASPSCCVTSATRWKKLTRRLTTALFIKPSKCSGPQATMPACPLPS